MCTGVPLHDKRGTGMPTWNSFGPRVGYVASSDSGDDALPPSSSTACACR